MSSNDWASLVPLVLLLVVAYLLLIRPARRRAMDIQRVQGALSVGDEVMLTSGIYGVVRGVDEDRMVLEVSNGVEVTVARAAVAQIIRDEPAAYDGEPDDAELRQPDEAAAEPTDAAAPPLGTESDNTSRDDVASEDRQDRGAS